MTLTDDAVRRAVATHWDLAGAMVTPHDGGMNSATWFVSHGDRRWVAKSVPAEHASDLAGGLAVAAMLDNTGAPAPARDGRLVVTVDGLPLALLTWVPGRPLTAGDQPLIGTTLAGIHRRLRGRDVPGAHRFHWVDPRAAHLGIEPWLRPAVAAAVDGLSTHDMTTGLLHTDPAPEAFLEEDGVCGLIDWAWALRGPLLYDLATAVMYVGGLDAAGPLLAAYAEAGVLPPVEVDRGLRPMLRFRYAVQADYFAKRIVAGDLTGIDDPSGNLDGLAGARLGLTGFSQVTTG